MQSQRLLPGAQARDKGREDHLTHPSQPRVDQLVAHRVAHQIRPSQLRVDHQVAHHRQVRVDFLIPFGFL